MGRQPAGLEPRLPTCSGLTILRIPSVSGFFRFLARVGDGMMKIRIVKIGFGEA